MRTGFHIVVLGCVSAVLAGCSDSGDQAGSVGAPTVLTKSEASGSRPAPSNPYEALLAEYRGEFRRASVAASEADDAARATARENFTAKDADFAAKFYELARKEP